MPNITLDITGPYSFLVEVFAIDEIAAVRIADKWGELSANEPENQERRHVALLIAEKQTVFPICRYCRWPVVDRHMFCENEIMNQLEEQQAIAEDDSYNMDDTLDDQAADHYDDCDDEPDEDPLAGDVDPDGGYPEPEMHPWDAHQLNVMRQHGDYTG